MRTDAEYAQMSLPKSGQCLVDDLTAIMDREYFEALYEYSCSLPTGTFVGKRWKRNSHQFNPRHPDVWYMGEYFELPAWVSPTLGIGPRHPTEVGIRWREIFVVGRERNEVKELRSKSGS